MAQPQGPTPDQDEALTTLVTQGTLTDKQVTAVRSALWPGRPAQPRSSPTSVLIEVAGYLGGGLMLGGAGLMVGLSWERLGRGGTALVLAGYALALIVAAVLVAGGPRRIVGLRSGRSPVRRRLVGTLLAVAAVPAALAAAVPTDSHPELAAGVVGLAVGLLGYAALPTVPGVLATATASVVTTIGLIQLDTGHHDHVPTLAFVGLGALWAIATAARLVRPPEVGFGIAAILAVIGGQLELGAGERAVWAYTVTFAVAIACFVGYWLARATVLLALGVIGSTIAVSEAVQDWTGNALSGPVVLLIAGAVLVGASALGLWLRSMRSSRPV